ncbi:MAG: hypothetical protein ACOCP8_04715 [archaeon]
MSMTGTKILIHKGVYEKAKNPNKEIRINKEVKGEILGSNKDNRKEYYVKILEGSKKGEEIIKK